MALRFSSSWSSLPLILLALTSCDAKWGGSAVNSELDRAQLIGCYRSPNAEPMLRITQTQIYADKAPIYSEYVYARLGKNDYQGLVVRPRMAIAVKQDSPRVCVFLPYNKGNGKDFNYRVTGTSDSKVIHMHLDYGEHVAFVRTDCPG